MDSSLPNLGYIFMYFIGFSFGGDSTERMLHDEWDSTFLDELFDGEDDFRRGLEISEFTGESIREDERPAHHTALPEKKQNSSKKRPRKTGDISQERKAFVCLGPGFKGNREVPESFENVPPPNVNPDNLSKEDIERKFRSLGELHQWEELQDYRVKEYGPYWGHVCQYFWNQQSQNVMRNRACYLRTSLLPETVSKVVYNFKPRKISKADLLACNCFYYITTCKESDCVKFNFAIHKYSSTEYILLMKKNGTRYDYAVSNFLTEVTLPTPIK